MEEALMIRLKLIIENVESYVRDGQKILEKIKTTEDFTETDMSEANMLCAKLKLSIERFVTEMHNYYRLATSPSADTLSTYTGIQIRAEELVVELNQGINAKNQNSKGLSTGLHISNVASKLPKMELARFNGNVLKWHEFWDQFSSNVDNRNISEVDKLLYVQSVLEGEAKRAIEGLDTTNKNYRIAVSTLKERYSKPSAIVDAHYAALYNIKAADRSVTDCRRVFNEIQRHLRVLESLGEDVNHNHLRVMIMHKFSEDLIYELRIKQGSDSYSIENIRSQIECIISAREASNRMSREMSSSELPSTSNHNNGRCSLETLHVATERRPSYRPKRYIQSNSRDGKMKYVGKRDNRRQSESKFNYNPRKRHLSKEKDEVDTKKRKPTCIFCGNGHFNDECDEIKAVLDRKRKLEGRCFNCLAKGHRSSECRSRKKCYHCGKFGDHNRALCPSKDLSKTNNLHIRDSKEIQKGLTVLQTAVVAAVKYNTFEHQVFRVLLDCGSQRSYVTKKVADLLNVPLLESNTLSVFTFGAERPREIESPVVRLDLKTRTNNKAIIYANVVPHITNSIPTVPNDLKKPLLEGLTLENLELADDSSMGDQVDILIGNDYYFSLMTGDKLKILDDLYLVNSIFGWVWSGKIVRDDNYYSDELSVLTYFQTSVEINGFCEPDLPLKRNDFQKLWDLESIGITDSPKTSRDEEAVKQFNNTTQFFDNRYHVKWPWIEYPPDLPSNLGLAHGRLVSLLKRLDKNTIQAYDKILREQLDQNIIELVSDTTDVEHPVHYLPHHCIARGDKLRLVYDASAKTKGNKSLNECLYRGPLLLTDLTGLLIRFREHYVGVVADVEKAFLQIGLQEEDRDVTRFLWLKNIGQSPSPQNLLHLRFQRVPFGVISSPFLLNAVVRYHLKKAGNAVHNKISDDLYVDNLVTGCDSVEDAKLLYQEARTSFGDLSMNLREWNSNLASIRDSIPLQYRCKETDYMKVLGLNWNLQEDSLTLLFDMTQNMVERTITKRETLRLLASVFDPCGYAVPLLLPAKLFLQNLWHEKIDWDTPFSEDIREKCKIAIENLKLIKNIKVPRCIKINDCETETYELHAFTDSSMQAYAAIVYLRISCNNTFTSRFVIGKGRLVGKEQQNDLQIPKLELLGALIGGRLIQTILKYTRLPIRKNFLWTDSQIVISWCSSDKLLPPFVTKRIEEIKRVPNLNIRYVPSLLNPADVATRPIVSNDGLNRWLQGPEFLVVDSDKWPHFPTAPASPNAILTNFCGGQGLAETTQKINEQGDRTDEEMSSVIKSSSSEGSKKDEEKELQTQLRQIQTDYYKEEMKGVETDLGRSLGIYKDENGLLRCGGRLNNTDWSYNQKHPILLPRNHEMTFKIIETIHQKNYHVGVSHTLSLVRKKYWVPKGRSQVQKVLYRCQSCRKYSGGPFKLPLMAQLPEERVTYSQPFTYTGLDYFGPITVSNNGLPEKRWVCLYTCLAVRAIHMEVLFDMTAEECLLALRRFMSTRGVPKLIISDNATQFKLTAEIFTSDYCILNDTKWKFIPELTPWFGGFYERLIGIVKHCLKRTIDKHLLNHHQLATVIKEVEAVVNSRPLTVVGTEPDHVLTPADFLCTGRFSLPASSEKEFLETGTVTKVDLVDGWKRGQRILREYIDMFTNQYLTSLRDRKTVHKQGRITVKSVPQIGQLVQIKGGSNRTLWKTGRISSVSKSKDGNIRVAKVTIAPNETLTRSIAHLYPLEIPDSDESYQASSSHKNIGSDTNDTQVTSQEPNYIPHRSQVLDPVRAPDQNQLRPRSTEQSTQSSENELKSDDGDQSARELLRPSRLSARRAREKVREWTTHLLISLRQEN